MEQWYEQRQKLAEKRAVLSREVRTLAADLTQRVKDQKPDPVSNGTPVKIIGSSGQPGFAVQNFRGADLTVVLQDEDDELKISPPVRLDNGAYIAITSISDDGLVTLRSINDMVADAEVERTKLMDALVLTAVELKKQLK
jgi:hypothetical protein